MTIENAEHDFEIVVEADVDNSVDEAMNGHASNIRVTLHENGSSITVAIGQSATCTINNDDQAASLTLVKTVTNEVVTQEELGGAITHTTKSGVADVATVGEGQELRGGAATELGHEVVRRRDEVRTRMPTPQEAQALGIAGGVPVLLPPQLSKSSLERLVRGLDALPGVADAHVAPSAFEAGFPALRKGLRRVRGREIRGRALSPGASQ